MVWKILGGFSFSFLVCGWEWRRRRTMLRPAPVNVNPFGGKYSPVHINNWPLQLFLATCRYWKRTAGSSSFSLFPWMLFYFKGRLFFFSGFKFFSRQLRSCAHCVHVLRNWSVVCCLWRTVLGRSWALLRLSGPQRQGVLLFLILCFFLSFFLSLSVVQRSGFIDGRFVCFFVSPPSSSRGDTNLEGPRRLSLSLSGYRVHPR